MNRPVFTKRIEEILKFYNVSAATFADTIGVGRSSISHILSGRNKPSLDLLLKIIETYPELNVRWFLQGKGTINAAEKIHANEWKEPSKPNTIETKKTTSSLPETTKNSHKKIAEKEQETLVNKAQKKIESMTCFFTDGTFKQYFPDDLS